MDNIEIPEYFICPISLQIMKDPVTAVSGITYDRESIEHWLFTTHNTICPATNQPLPENSELTPNHTLRRLIQAWCTLYGAVDRIPTPKTPLTKFYVINLVKDLRVPNLQLKTLKKLEALAIESDRNRNYMVEAGVGKSLINIIVSCYRKGEFSGVEEALSVLYLIRVPFVQSGSGLPGNDEVVDSLTWVLGLECFSGVKTAAYALKTVVQLNRRLLERLNRVFFQTVSCCLRQHGDVGVNAILHVLLEACSWGRNRGMMIESGTVFDVIEVELRESAKKTTEMVLGIIYHLCSCADGRAQLLSHAAGLAAVTRRILKVSATADDRAVLIIWLISKYSATNGVLVEMLRVGSVAKLCVVIQANCESHLKEKAREVLRMHFDVWKDSPCVEVATLTRYMR
ncbi:hypothetical protein ACS0TY_016396 [Phlomoides rotata]